VGYEGIVGRERGVHKSCYFRRSKNEKSNNKNDTQELLWDFDMYMTITVHASHSIPLNGGSAIKLVLLPHYRPEKPLLDDPGSRKTM